jgi:uncharacterized protein (TIGR04551 family)
MRIASLAVASLVLCASPVARSQTKSSTLAEQWREELKEQLREELKEEIKAEIKAELQSDAAVEGPVQDDAWAEEEWKWEEPPKPELNFLEFDGYFRFRYDLFNKLDLKTYYYNAEDNIEYGPFALGFAPPTPICTTDQRDRGNGAPGDAGFRPEATSCANTAGPSATIGSANMRLRLEPVFNVYEDIKVKMQMDVLDNLVLGSTPDGFPTNPISPLLAFSQSQNSPSDGVNSLTDSIRVKRAWAEVMTPLGQLRVGRMPSHFGMGLLANGGNGIDSDFGDTNDRIMFATKIGDFYIVPAYDWALSGPTSAQRELPYGQPFDRDNRDDVDQYILAIAVRDTDEEIKQKLENDEVVVNFGTYQVGRFQALDSASFYQAGDPDGQAQAKDLIERDAQAWAYSAWFKLIYRDFLVEAEYAGILGRIGNSAFAGPYGTEDKELKINQHAAALNLEYKLLRDALTIRLLTVVASGDSAAGWGIRPLLSQSNTPGSWDGTQAPEGDDRITNFRIDPDFFVDMIFWRQLVGMVTDAFVIRPGVQYNLTEGFGARLDVVYSRAFFSNSTPSGSFTDLTGDGINDLGTPNPNLGLEADLTVFFDSDDGFHAWIAYGIFIPFAGLDRRVQVESDGPGEREVLVAPDGSSDFYRKLDASVAHTIQALLGVTF